MSDDAPFYAPNQKRAVRTADSLCLVGAVVGLFVGFTARADVRSAQAPATLTFEVTSVKPATREVLLQRGFRCVFGAGERFMALQTIHGLIACAYGIPAARAGQEIAGGPKWLDDDLVEVTATPPSGHAPPSRSESLAMLRALLADRFKLVVHRETKEFRCGRSSSRAVTDGSAHSFVRRQPTARRGSPAAGAGHRLRLPPPTCPAAADR